MRVINFNSIEEMQKFLVDKTVEILALALKTQREATFSIGGGRFPPGLIRLLAKQNLCWEKINILIGDERCVPHTSNHSNEANLRNLLQELSIHPKQLLGLYDGLSEPIEAKQKAESELKHISLPMDVTFLGMGEDGHFAGLFSSTPVAEILNTNHQLCLTPSNKDSLIGNHWRISLNLNQLTNSRHIFLHAPGKKKADLLNQLLSGNHLDKRYPIQHLLGKNLENLYICLCDQVD